MTKTKKTNKSTNKYRRVTKKKLAEMTPAEKAWAIRTPTYRREIALRSWETRMANMKAADKVKKARAKARKAKRMAKAA